MTKLEQMLQILRSNRPKKGKGSYYEHSTEEYMSEQIRNFHFHLGDFIATNLDWVFYSEKSNRLMLIEQKVKNADLSNGQKILWSILDDALKHIEYINYLGFYELKFENTCFEDGQVKLIQLFTTTPKNYSFNSYNEFKTFMKKEFKQ